MGSLALRGTLRGAEESRTGSGAAGAEPPQGAEERKRVEIGNDMHDCPKVCEG